MGGRTSKWNSKHARDNKTTIEMRGIPREGERNRKRGSERLRGQSREGKGEMKLRTQSRCSPSTGQRKSRDSLASRREEGGPAGDHAE